MFTNESSVASIAGEKQEVMMKSNALVSKRISLITMAALMSGSAALRPAPAQPRGETALLQLLPNGEGVVTLDVQRVIGSELWALVSSQGRLKNLIGQAQSELGALGLETSDLKTAAIAVPGDGRESFVAVVTGRFNETGLLARLREDKRVAISSGDYKNVRVHLLAQSGATGQAYSDIAFAFYDSGTLVVGSLGGVKAAIDVRAGDQPGIARNQKYAGVLEQLPAGAVGLALSPQPLLGHMPKDMPLPLPDLKNVNLIFGSVDVGSGIDLNLIFRNDTAEQGVSMAVNLKVLLKTATGVLKVAKKGKYAPVADALKTFSISNNGPDVKVTGALSKELFAQFLK